LLQRQLLLREEAGVDVEKRHWWMMTALNPQHQSCQ